MLDPCNREDVPPFFFLSEPGSEFFLKTTRWNGSRENDEREGDGFLFVLLSLFFLILIARVEQP